MKQIHVDINPAWPYNITEYAIDYNPLEVPSKDLREKFITYTNAVDNTVPLYIFLTSKGAFYFSLERTVPDGMIRAFNPAIFVMDTVFADFKCIGGVVMPALEKSNEDVSSLLETCQFQDFTGVLEEKKKAASEKQARMAAQMAVSTAENNQFVTIFIVACAVIVGLVILFNAKSNQQPLNLPIY
jgi:hypothetical protein